MGVYVIRMKGGELISRFDGSSDIVYIGMTEKQGFKGRFKHYIKPTDTQLTNKRINKFSKKHGLEVAFARCKFPRMVEDILLKNYLFEHNELPPLNNSEPR